MKVQIEAVSFKADQKLLEFIDQKVGKLDTFFDRIIEVNVALKLENAGQVKDKIVELRVSVPGDILVVKEVSKAFEGATDAAVDSMKRQLKRYKEMRAQA